MWPLSYLPGFFSRPIYYQAAAGVPSQGRHGVSEGSAFPALVETMFLTIIILLLIALWFLWLLPQSPRAKHAETDPRRVTPTMAHLQPPELPCLLPHRGATGRLPTRCRTVTWVAGAAAQMQDTIQSTRHWSGSWKPRPPRFCHSYIYIYILCISNTYIYIYIYIYTHNYMLSL